MNEISRRETVALELSRHTAHAVLQDLDVQTEYNDALLPAIMVRAES